MASISVRLAPEARHISPKPVSVSVLCTTRSDACYYIPRARPRMPFSYVKNLVRVCTVDGGGAAAISVGAVVRFVEETWGIPRAPVGIHSYPVVRFARSES